MYTNPPPLFLPPPSLLQLPSLPPLTLPISTQFIQILDIIPHSVPTHCPL